MGYVSLCHLTRAGRRVRERGIEGPRRGRAGEAHDDDGWVGDESRTRGPVLHTRGAGMVPGDERRWVGEQGAHEGRPYYGRGFALGQAGLKKSSMSAASHGDETGGLTTNMPLSMVLHLFYV